MPANGNVTLAWADGDHEFNASKIGLVLELEDKCGCGVMEIFTRLSEGRWKISDVREPIRLGLIGGGKSPAEALVLTKRYVDERPFAESVMVARAILMAAIIGVPGDPVGKKKPRKRKATGELSDQQSTAPGPSSGGHPEKPTKQPSGNLQPESTATTEHRAAMTKNPTP